MNKKYFAVVISLLVITAAFCFFFITRFNKSEKTPSGSNGGDTRTSPRNAPTIYHESEFSAYSIGTDDDKLTVSFPQLQTKLFLENTFEADIGPDLLLVGDGVILLKFTRSDSPYGFLPVLGNLTNQEMAMRMSYSSVQSRENIIDNLGYSHQVFFSNKQFNDQDICNGKIETGLKVEYDAQRSTSPCMEDVLVFSKTGTEGGEQIFLEAICMMKSEEDLNRCLEIMEKFKLDITNQ